MQKNNRKLHFIVFQTTKKPFKFSINKLFVYSLFPVIIIMFTLLSVNMYYTYQKNVCLNEKVAELEKKNESLSNYESIVLAENRGLKSNLDTKTSQIEKYQDELEILKGAVQNIKEKFNIDDDVENKKEAEAGKKDNYGSASSRSGYRIMNTKETNEILNEDNSNSIISDNFNQVYDDTIKDKQLIGEMTELKAEIEDLEKDIQQKIDYYKDMPLNFPAYGQITSYYGPRWGSFHRGIDIANDKGTKIYAAGNGTVTECSYNSSYGYYITIQHKYGFSTRYAHLSKTLVKVGDIINQCDVIGLMGSTGYSTGTHLHYEIHYLDDFINPLSIEEYLEY